MIVTTEKCNACHGSLAFHGDARNTVENCVTCHNPTATAGRGAEAVSIDFRLMVHRIHRGHALTRPYVIGSHNYNEVGYPGDLRNCGACHVNGSEQLPLKADLSLVSDPNGPMNPLWPTAAACTSCHDSNTAAAHVQANTTRLGESCATCHGPDAQFAIGRVHKP
jgi:OmcA/MtrC family decaheme c-type cytochrome